ncbi:MAG: cobalt ECF transporter T component CbiQ [Nitrospirota bacterium]|nr:MAG: cobalt ECF transporter T component CbiQ [Nitrospirota bacterium]
MKNNIPSFLMDKRASEVVYENKRIRANFIEKGIGSMASFMRSGHIQWRSFLKKGFFQKLDARVKLFFLLLFVIIVSIKKEFMPEVLIGGIVFLLVVLSRLDIVRFYRKVLLFGLIFGFIVALPAALNIITKGEIILPLIHLPRDYDIWIYYIPADIGITREGSRAVMMLTSRVINSVSISFLVLYTTPFPQIIKALKMLRVPDAFLLIITLSYKYIFLFIKTIEDMYLAKKSRMVCKVHNPDARGWITGRMALLYRKSQGRFEEVYRAMNSRGFSDDIKVYKHPGFENRDRVAGAVLLVVGMLLVVM